MKGRGPDIAKLLGGQPTGAPAFDVSAAKKDLSTMAAFAKILGVEVPVVEAAIGGYTAAEQAGFSAADPINLPVFWSRKH